MRKKKFVARIMAFLMTASLLFPATLMPMSVSAAASAYDLIPATSFDRALSKENSSLKFEVYADRVGSVYDDGYLAFTGIDFGNEPPTRVYAKGAARSGYAEGIKVMIDDPASEPIAIVPITPETFQIGYTNYADIELPITGVHNVYITTDKKTMNFFEFQFFKVEKDKATFEVYNGGSDYTDIEGKAAIKADLLKQLGLIRYEGDKLEPEIPVTRGDFARAVYGICVDSLKEDEEALLAQAEGRTLPVTDSAFSDIANDSPYCKPAAYLSESGIMNGTGGGEFRPSRYITELEAATALVRALGYGTTAEELGGYPNGYITLVGRLGIAKNLNSDKILTRSRLLDVLCNALESDYLMPVGVSNDYVKYNKQSGILAYTQKKYYGKGQVEETPFSSLGMPGSDLSVNEVIIGGNVYSVGSTKARGMLGFECEFYYEEDAMGDRTLCAIVPVSNCEFTDITPKDNIIDISNDEIKYAPADESKDVSVEIEGDAYVIYNGVASETDFEGSFANKDNFTGTIRVINNDECRQVISIEEYDDYIVESLSPDGTGITSDGAGTGVYWDSDDFVIIEDKDGNPIEFFDIKLDSIISVYESDNKTGKRLIRIYIGESETSGLVNKTEGNYVYVDDVKYMVSNNMTKPPVIGRKAVFRLNIFGDIVAEIPEEPSEWQTGLFMGVSSNRDPFETLLEVKIITNEGKSVIYKTAKRLTADGVRITDGAAMLNGENGFSGISNITAESAIRYKINSAGELSAIDTEKTVGETDANDCLVCRYDGYNGSGRFAYSRKYRFLIENYGQKDIGRPIFFAEHDTTMFVFYGDSGNRDENCIVGSLNSLIIDEKTEMIGLKLYSCTDKNYEVDTVVWKNGMVSNGTLYRLKSGFVYSSYAESLNEDGDEIILIKGWQSGGWVEYKLDTSRVHNADGLKFFTDGCAKAGDVFDVMLYPDNTLYTATPVLLVDGKAARKGFSGTITMHTGYTLSGSTLNERKVYGRVIDREGDYVTVQTGGTAAKPTYELVNIGSVSICLVSQRSDGTTLLESIEPDNISAGDVLYATYWSGNFDGVVVYDIDDIKFSFDGEEE